MSEAWKRRCSLGIRVVVVLLVGGACVHFVRNLDVSAVGGALSRASLPLVVLAAVVNLLIFLWRAARMQRLLAPLRRVGIARLIHYDLASGAASNLLPARVGELLRLYLLKAREGNPGAPVVAAMLVERVFEVGAAFLLMAPLPLLLHGLPRWVATSLITAGTIGVLATVALVVLLRLGRDPASRLSRFVAGIQEVRRPSTALFCFSCSLLVWLTDATQITLILRAVGVDVPLPAAILVLLGVNLAIAVPSTPAQVGAFEIGAVVALELLGVPREQALAFALVYHAIQVVPVTLLGLDGLRLAARIRREAAAEPPALAGPGELPPALGAGAAGTGP